MREAPAWKGFVTDDRSAALLVRIWLEDDGRAFRARMLAVGGDGDGAGDGRTVALVSSPGDLLSAMSDWLDEFLRDRTE
jgi:hypothetical protein